MYQKLTRLLSESETQGPEALASSVFALLRISLQHLCIGLAEWIITQLKSKTATQLLETPLELTELRSPSDGTLVRCLSNLLVAAENVGWAHISDPWWDHLPREAPAARLSLRSHATLESVVLGIVVERNESVEGHGLPGDRDFEAMFDGLRTLIERYKFLFPECDDRSDLLHLSDPSGRKLRLTLLRTVQGDLVCYREIKPRPGNMCIVRAQRQISLSSRDVETWETRDILATELGKNEGYRICRTSSSDWCPLVLTPERVTSHFKGRVPQILELLDWIDDRESRACLLFGDGGIGKTTLALEFLHRILDGELRTDWKPEIVTFYTAKQTRWGIDGLERIRTAPVGVSDVALDLYRALEGKQPDRSWYDKQPAEVIDKLAGLLSTWGIKKDQHLLILDNTETMADSEEEIRQLVSQVRHLARRVGRVLLTSRRREPIEARQISVPPLEVEESVSLLRVRGEELRRKPIMQAGDSTLRQICNKLGNRPLVLEVFIQTLRDERLSLDRAFDRVLRMERQDLGEFLYTDAWNRFSQRMKILVLLMTRVSDIHDEILVKLCCQQAEVSVIDAYDGLGESVGIASITRIDGHRQVTFSPDFLRFAGSRDVKDAGRDMPPVEWIEKVRRRYSEFIKNRSAKIRDRVSVAYRTPFARAAWQAFQEKRFDDCETFYELAVVEDQDNGLLFDRYAYFLFSRRRYEDSLGKAQEATRLAPDDSETWFTKGLVEARLGLADEAELSLMRASAQGKPEHLCYLQIGHALLNCDPGRPSDALAFLVKAKQTMTREDSHYYRSKHLAEVTSLERKAALLLKRRPVT